VRPMLRPIFIAAAIASAPLPHPASAADPNADVARGRAMAQTFLGMLASDPFDAYALRRLIEVAPDAGGLGAVIGLARERTQAPGAGFGDLLALGQLQAAGGAHREALAAFAAAEKLRAGRWETAALEAASQRALGETAAALAAFDRAAAGKGGDAQRRQAMLEGAVGLATDMRDEARARRYADALVAVAPNDPYPRQIQAAMLVRFGHVDDAIAVWNGVEARAGGSLETLVLAWRERATIEEQAGRFDAAEATWRRALDRVPRGHHERPGLWYGLAGVARQAGRLEALVDELATTHRRDDEALILLANLLDELARDAEALAAWREAVARMPRRDDVRIAMLRLLERAGTPDDLIAAWTELVKVSPREPRFRLRLADILLLHGKNPEGLAQLRGLAKDFGSDPGVQQQVLERWLRRRNKDDRKDIEAIYRQLMRLEPREGDHVLSHGSWLWSLGDKAAAIAMWRRLVQLEPNGGRGLFRVAQAMFDHELYDDADKTLAEVLKQAPSNPEYLRLKAQLEVRRRRIDNAIAVWLEIARLVGPDTAAGFEARENIIDLWTEQRVVENRVKDLDQRVRARLADTAAPTAATLAEGRLALDAHVRLGALDAARELLDLLAARGGAGRAVLTVGEQLAVRQGDLAAARTFAEKLAAEDPARAHEHLRRAAAHARQSGGRDDAIRLVRAGVEAQPGVAASHRAAGDLFAQLGMAREALEAFERAANLDPADMELRFRIAGLHRLASHRGREVAMLETIVRDGRDSRDVQRAGRRLLDLGAAGLDGAALDAFEAMVRQRAEGGQQSSAHARILLELQLSRALRLVADHRFVSGDMPESLREALARIGDRALRALSEGLFSTDQGLRDAALRLSELTLPPAAVPALGRLAADPEPAIAARAVAALGAIGSEGAVKLLARIHADRQHRAREVALWAAGLSAGPHALGLIDTASQSTNQRDRLLAALAAGNQPASAIGPVLARLVADSAQDVREAAIRACARHFAAIAANPSVFQSNPALEAAILKTAGEGRALRPETVSALIELASSPLSETLRDAWLMQLTRGLWTDAVADDTALVLLEALLTPPPPASDGIHRAAYRAMFRTATGTLVGIAPMRIGANHGNDADGSERLVRLLAQPRIASAAIDALRRALGTGSGASPAANQRAVDGRSLAALAASRARWPASFATTFRDLDDTTRQQLVSVATHHPNPATRLDALTLALSVAAPPPAVATLVETTSDADFLHLLERIEIPASQAFVARLALFSPATVPLVLHEKVAIAIATHAANDTALLVRWLGATDPHARTTLVNALASRAAPTRALAPHLVEHALGSDPAVAVAAARALAAHAPERLPALRTSPFAAVRALAPGS
jgi:tetratricopeptide (TPR) repeat protein